MSLGCEIHALIFFFCLFLRTFEVTNQWVTVNQWYAGGLVEEQSGMQCFQGSCYFWTFMAINDQTFHKWTLWCYFISASVLPLMMFYQDNKFICQHSSSLRMTLIWVWTSKVLWGKRHCITVTMCFLCEAVTWYRILNGVYLMVKGCVDSTISIKCKRECKLTVWAKLKSHCLKPTCKYFHMLTVM